jgi:hypothetical protein
VNYWWAQIIPRDPLVPRIDARCICCLGRPPETILHRFHHCDKAHAAWDYGLTILYLSQRIPKVNGQWDNLTWQQCVLGSKLPHKLKKGTALWSILRGSIIWTTWLDRNAQCFQQDNWSGAKLQALLWDAFFTLARTAWTRTIQLCQAQPRLTGKYLANFDKVWMTSNSFGSRLNFQVHWTFRPPPVGSFSL